MRKKKKKKEEVKEEKEECDRASEGRPACFAVIFSLFYALPSLLHFS